MESKTGKAKVLQGVVVKSAMKDTIVVSVERYVQHPKYKKYQRLRKKYLVHDAGNTAKVGDTVTIRETRPLSKSKNFTLQERVVKAAAEE